MNSLSSYITKFKADAQQGIGLYIHIPFCHKACHYCNFFFVTQLDKRTEFIAALNDEISIRKSESMSCPIRSIYFGGGTPSLLHYEEFESILHTIQSNYDVSSLAEMTIEANPEDLTNEKLLEFKQLGFNRISLGVQSFEPIDLTTMNRAHNSAQACSAIELIKKYFDNFSIDLMFGLPNMTLEIWKKNLSKAIEYEVPHISTYNLTVEEKTALERLIKNKKLTPTADQLNSDFYLFALDYLDQQGLVNYEISNFGKQNHWAIHNTSYWLDRPYLGFGPSAHSFDRESRRHNLNHLKTYIQSPKADKNWYEIEPLTKNNQYNEFIMTKLRTIFGLNPLEIQKYFGIEMANHFQSQLQKYIAQKMIILQNNIYTLTPEGKLWADKISADLMIVD